MQRPPEQIPRGGDVPFNFGLRRYEFFCYFIKHILLVMNQNGKGKIFVLYFYISMPSIDVNKIGDEFNEEGEKEL